MSAQFSMDLKELRPDFYTKCYNGRFSAIDRATYDGLGSPVGYGENISEAIADLKQQLIERGLYANIE